MCSYRVLHRLHHNHLYESRDPDLPLHAGYPRGRGYLVRKLARDLTGRTAVKTYSYFFGAPAAATRAARADSRSTLSSPPVASRAASEAMVEAGATITHHHAVGTDHRPWLVHEIGEVGVRVLRAVKAELDPAGVLNPGVLVA